MEMNAGKQFSVLERLVRYLWLLLPRLYNFISAVWAVSTMMGTGRDQPDFFHDSNPEISGNPRSR